MQKIKTIIKNQTRKMIFNYYIRKIKKSKKIELDNNFILHFIDFLRKEKVIDSMQSITLKELLKKSNI